MEESGGQASGREAVRHRVERSLEETLGSLRVLVKGQTRREDTAEYFEDQLLAFEGAELLSKSEAAAWRTRFSRALESVQAPGDAITPEVRACTVDLLSAHIARLGTAGGEERASGEAGRFFEMLHALEDIGALSKEQKERWKERRESALGRAKPPPAAPRADLRRVLVGPPRRLGGVRVTCAELWTDWVTLCWHRVKSSEETAEDDRHRLLNEREYPMHDWRCAAERFELHDDIGTPYEAQLLGSTERGPHVAVSAMLKKAGESLPVWGRATFVPAVPEEASHLKAISGSNRFPLSLV